MVDTELPARISLYRPTPGSPGRSIHKTSPAYLYLISKYYCSRSANNISAHCDCITPYHAATVYNYVAYDNNDRAIYFSIDFKISIGNNDVRIYPLILLNKIISVVPFGFFVTITQKPFFC